MGSIYPAALSHFAVFCPALGPDEDNTHEQLLFYAAAALPAFYPYSPNDYFARNVHLRRRSSGGPAETAQAGHGVWAPTAAGKSPTRHRAAAAATAGDGGPVVQPSGVKGGDAVVQERVVSLDIKLREIGIGTALVAFAGSFSATAQRPRFHTVHSEKRRTLIFEPEPGVLIQLSVVLPRRVKPYGKEKDAYSIEFLDSELSDQALRAWLCQEYWAFRILFGPITRALERSAGIQEKQRVKRQLDTFFGKTLWSWDQRWDPKSGDELDLFCALQPLPLVPIGPISLGGFDEFWRDLASLTADSLDAGDSASDGRQDAQPLVHAAVVLWRGVEIVWTSWLSDDHTHDGAGSRADSASTERAHMLRALVAWSRAVYAPTFAPARGAADSTAPIERKAGTGARRPHVHRQYAGQSTARDVPRSSLSPSIAESPPPLPPHAASLANEHHYHQQQRGQGAEAGGWTLPGASWLWGWRGSEETPAQPTRPSQLTQPSIPASAEGRDSEDSGSEDSKASDESSARAPTDTVLGGLSQALSRAVDALVEPRPQTPPDVDPMFASDDRHAGTVSEQVSGRRFTPALSPAAAAATGQYTISAADIEAAHAGGRAPFARDSDVESLQSVGSLASIQTTRTTVTASVALSRHMGVGRSSVASNLGRTRSNTVQHSNVLANALSTVPGMLHGWQPNHMRRGAPGYGRASSIASNTSVATMESTLLRGDTRVSSRSWWPTSWSWGAGSSQSPTNTLSGDGDLPAASSHALADGVLDDLSAEDGGMPPSGMDLASTFLYTGELTFPGLGVDKQQQQHPLPAKVEGDSEAESVSSSSAQSLGSSKPSDDGVQPPETINQLGQAMEEAIPAVYEHGVGVDSSRGVVLAPRGLSGMLYDTRHLKALFPGGASENAAAEHQIFVCEDNSSNISSKTLVYKYGDLLFMLFGPSSERRGRSDDGDLSSKCKLSDSDGAPDQKPPRRFRGRRARARGRAQVPRSDGEKQKQQQQERFSADAARSIEQSILRYAESLQAATRRDVIELEAQRRNEVQLAQQRRIPPYVYREGGGAISSTLVQTSWKYQEFMPTNRSFIGYAGSNSVGQQKLEAHGANGSIGKGRAATRGRGTKSLVDVPVPPSVRQALSVVSTEVNKAHGDIAVCVRMQDKGWVAGSLATGAHCYCLVDQPKATLADAQNFLSRIARRASLQQSPMSPTS